MPVTIHDLARLSGLNASTISRALRNDPRVRESTRELVRELARKHGYAPNLPARQLAAGKTFNIWFSFGSPQAAIELETALELNEHIHRAGYDLQLVLHANAAPRLKRQLEKLRQKVADGALIIPPGDTDACEKLTALVNALPVPHVFIDRYWPGLECPVITTDNASAVRKLVDRCAEWGAREFYLEFSGCNPVSRLRAENARDRIARLGLAAHPLCELAAAPAGIPAAVIASSGWDVRQLPVPAGLELYGGFFDHCDDAVRPFCRRVIVCRQNFPAIADCAARLLLQMLGNPEAPLPRLTEIPALEFPEM